MTVLLQRIPKYPLSVSHSVSSRSPRAHYNTVTQRTAPHPARKIGKVSVGQNYNVGRSAAWAVGSFHTQAQFHLTYQSISQVLLDQLSISYPINLNMNF